MHIQIKQDQKNLLRMFGWIRWQCAPDIGFEIRALGVWGRARNLSVTEAPYTTESSRVRRVETFCFFETWLPERDETASSAVIGLLCNHLFKFSTTWCCASLPRSTTSRGWKWYNSSYVSNIRIYNYERKRIEWFTYYLVEIFIMWLFCVTVFFWEKFILCAYNIHIS